MKISKLSPLLVFISLALILSSVCFAQEPLSSKDLTADVKDSSVYLTWTPPVDTTIAGFNIYRKEDTSSRDYEKVNNKLITASDYNDRSVSKGKSYSFICRSVNTDGIESTASNIAGAPKMQMKASAQVSHMGRTVRIAAPGDVIKYSIEFANQGYGVAKNVVIVYAIPKGTTYISGTANCPKYKVKIAYFNSKTASWSDSMTDEESISKVRFTVLEDVFPVVKDKNDIASLKVMVNY